MKMRHSILFVFIIAACGNHREAEKQPDQGLDSGPSNQALFQDAIVKERGILDLTVSNKRENNGTQPVTVTYAPNASMTLDTSKFVVPNISNAVLDFGSLKVKTLTDNNLKVCGGKQCGTAILRIYTTGVEGPGLWNATDKYGAPMTASLTTPLTVGLNAIGAAVMQTYTIPDSKHVLKLSDFTPAPTYNVKFDFTNAGAATYSTTIVVEYALAP